MKAGILTRNDQAMTTHSAASKIIDYHLLRAVTLKHVESLLKTGALNKYCIICQEIRTTPFVKQHRQLVII